jgi:hexosaminidase
MKIYRNILIIPVLFAMIGWIACNNRQHVVGSIIPLPASMKYTGGTFLLKKQVTIGYYSCEIESLIPFLTNYLEEHSMICSVNHVDSTANIDPINIFLLLDEKYKLPSENYKMEITESSCKIMASTTSGLFYGLQSLRQLINQSPKRKLLFPTMIIEDSPRFEWRGMHLDVARHFMPKEFLKQYIDYLAFLKMNVFHWHLVDDQGWRIEIKRYPKLTQIGAWRDSTWMGHDENGTGKYDRIRYGGFYSQEDIREIVDYASERFITVVPEIEIPGHSQAAIASYPELGCTDDTVRVFPKWGISPYIYNIDESTFEFLFGVLDEVMELFPSPYIHIGGDEALKDQWKSSTKIQQQMRQLKIKDEIALQGYFTKRIEEYLRSKGRNTIGWDEILEGDLPEAASVMSWRGTEGGITAAKSGHKVVMTPTEYCYFDYYQSEDKSEPLAIGGYLPIEKVYSYDPIPQELNAEEAEYIIGVQGNVWTEYLDSPQKVQYMIFPRIFAMAEIQWSNQYRKDFEEFKVRLKAMEPYLKKNQINYAKHCFTKND